MVYTERDVMVRQEQCKDWLREAGNLEQAGEKESRPPRSAARALLALPVIVFSVVARLLGTFMHLGHHRL